MPTILGANTLSSGYDVANSLRFDKPSDSYLAKTFSSAGSTRKFTFSTWLKGHDTSVHGSTYFFVGNINGSSNIDAIGITDSGIQVSINSATEGSLNSTALFRDMSAWYHFVIGVDTTQGTASNRVKVYINGTQVTAWDTETYPDQNYDFTGINSTEAHNVSYSDSEHNGYLCETVFIDGTQYAADSFGEFDEDSPTIWKPKSVSGLTFGQNGFYLEYKQTGTSANSSGLGADTSGNDHHFSVNGLAAVDQSTDTCTNNFATMNPLILGSGTTLSEGNLQINPGTNSTGFHSASTLGVSTGKWYWEAKLVSGTKGAFGIIFDGSSGHVFEHQRNDKMPGGFSGNDNSWGYKPGNAGNVENNAGDITFSGVTATSSNILGFAMDLDNGALYIHKDGTYMNSGNPASGASKTGAIDISGGDDGFVFPAYGDSDTGASPAAAYNFGNPPYSESGGESDADGHGNFNQSVPSGYFALCSKNLAEYG